MDSWDVAVVGGGPVGSLAARAFADRGARVLLLEGNPKSSQRFAGEWLQPSGVGVLDRLGLGRLDGARPQTAYGFAVFPDGGSDSIALRYPAGEVALAAEHSALVDQLRGLATCHPQVSYRPNTRVTAVGDHQLSLRDKSGPYEVRAALIVGADGRSSLVRKSLGFPDSALISNLASVVLEDVVLPHERFGHVLLGGPGPVLLYRIDERRVRVCLDLPEGALDGARDPEILWHGFHHILPPELVPAFRRALASGPVTWAAARFQARSHLGRGDVALVGDAAGHFHPLTASGLSQGFLDVEALVRAVEAGGSVAAYQRAREPQSHVAELLACALYEVFRREDPGATSIRRAVFRAWRASRRERDATMAILGGTATRADFGLAFSRMGLRAAARSVKEGGPAALLGMREWLAWPTASALPRRLRAAVRGRAAHTRPLGHRSDASIRAVAPRRRRETAPETSELRRAIDALVDGLHSELESLSTVFGTVDDLSLARFALPLLHAVGRANTSSGMAIRMRLGRRRVASDGPAVYLRAHAGGHSERATRDLAELVNCLYDFRGSQVDFAEGAVLEVVDALASLQTDSGGFPERLGQRPELDATTAAMTALAAAAAHLPARSRELQPRLARAASWMQHIQMDDGRFPGHRGIRTTSAAVLSLRAAGVPTTDPTIRRAASWLRARQQDDGRFCELGTAAPSAQATALALRALIASGPLGPRDWAAGRWLVAGALERRRKNPDGRPQIARSHRELRAACDELAALSDLLDARTQAQSRPDGEAEVGPAPAANPAARFHRDRPSAADLDYCREALRRVSRTFSRPIELLPGGLRDAVTCAYLLCRLVDCIEDFEDITPQRRNRLFEAFIDALRGSDTALIRGEFAEMQGSSDEIDLGRQCERVFRVHRSQRPEVQAACERWVAEMARGMQLYRQRQPAPGCNGVIAVEDVADLERYCYFVAGTVGHLLTDLFLIELGVPANEALALELRSRAESFGIGLQLVNILKDVSDDLARGVSYIPRAQCFGAGIDPAVLLSTEVRERAHAAAAPLFERARTHLDGALEYTLTIPAEHPQVRLFCLLPLWMAARTLVLAKGNDAMFTSGQPVKISRAEVEQLIGECANLVAADDQLRTRYRALWAAASAAETSEAGR